MLAENGDEKNGERLLLNDEWIAQQKVDGQRILVTVDDGDVRFLNRQGVPKSTMVTPALKAEFARFNVGSWVFDGEILDGVFWLFDMPVAGDAVSPEDPLAYRAEILAGFAAQPQIGWTDNTGPVRLLPTAEGTDAKIALRDRVRDFGGEGLMLKNLNGRYSPGLRSRHIVKYKFVNTVDCVVLAVNSNGKENLTLGLFKPGATKATDVGDCTGRAGDGSAAFKVDDVAEVRYLYFGAGGRLYQPTYPIKRDDKSPHECTWDQLVHVKKGVLV